jgi:hypothetical protein
VKLWDLLFRRYASPFDFLKGIDEMGMFDEALKEILHEEQEEKLWQMYLHSMSDKTFNDWKKAVVEKTPQPTKAMTKNEVMTEINKSKQLLKCFS